MLWGQTVHLLFFHFLPDKLKVGINETTIKKCSNGIEIISGNPLKKTIRFNTHLSLLFSCGTAACMALDSWRNMTVNIITHVPSKFFFTFKFLPIFWRKKTTLFWRFNSIYLKDLPHTKVTKYGNCIVMKMLVNNALYIN